MTTIQSHTPLRFLAHILHAAAAAGSDAWRPDNALSTDAGSESTLANDLQALFALLREREVSYLLVGGVALLRYIEGRNTDDIDLIIALEGAARVPGIVIEQRSDHAAKARFRTVRVDLLLTSNKVFQLAKESYATIHQFAEVAVPCATVEGLVLLKLYALPALYQQGDMQRAALYETDVLMLCQRYGPDVDAILKALQPHLTPGEFEELGRIAAEIAQRLQRMKRSAGE